MFVCRTSSNHLIMIKLSRKVIFFGCWKSLSAASKCRKTRPCDHRISKFYGGACPRTPLGIKALWALPILCPGVKLSCPPVENLEWNDIQEWNDILELWIVQNAQHYNLSFTIIIFTCPHDINIIWDYTLNWIKRKYYYQKIHKV